MSRIYEKMKLKDTARILVLNMPEALRTALLDVDAQVDEAADGVYGLVLLFAKDKAAFGNGADAALAALDGGEFWLAYPKKSSKNYQADFNRDDTWAMSKPFGLRPVFQIALDEDWSALRMRPI